MKTLFKDLLVAILSVVGMVAQAQNIHSVVGTYAVSEVCTLVEDTSYKESLDYTITLEAWQEQEYCMRFLIPTHGIPDFVLVESINDGNFSFAQKFNLEDSMGGEPYYLHINGNGRVQKDSLLMEYMLATIGAYGSLQCNVKGVRQILGTEEDYLEEGKKWTMQSLVSGMMFDGGYVNYYTFSILDEVEKFGYVWKRSSTAGSDFLLYRQERKKIWAVNQYSKIHTVPFLMFDFGLGKGDTAHLYVDTVWHIDDAWIVEDVFDSVFESGQTARHCQSVYLMNYPDRKDLWVEGIGSLTNGLTYMPANTVGGFAELICLQTSAKEVLYRNSNYRECEYPNHFSYDYSIQNWSVLCTEEHLHTESMYFKENGPKQWHQAYCATKEDFSDEKHLGLYYQDMLQVYFKENENAPTVLLFDFGLEKGESALVSDKVLWMVDSVYYLEIDGLKRRCQQMVSENGETDIWIEGLGSLKTGFFPTEFFPGTTELLCVQADVFWHRDYMYHNTKYNTCHIEEKTDSESHTAQRFSVSVSSNPIRDRFRIISDIELKEWWVYSVLGKLILSGKGNNMEINCQDWASGIYVFRWESRNHETGFIKIVKE